MAAFSRSRSGGSFGSGPSRHNSAGDSTPVSQLDDEDRGSLEPFLPSVVQVFCSSAANDWSMPWSRALPVKSTGSGWIYDVDKRIIVTNAHVVEFASTLQVAAAAIHARRCFTGPQVRKEGDAEKYEAQVLVIAYQVLIAPLRH
jgi:S1-C subfamily serine protease